MNLSNQQPSGKQVLIELVRLGPISQKVEEALEHTPPETKVHISLELDEDLCLIVEDNGPGMPPEVFTRAFEPGFSGGAEKSERGAGQGLGLYIARRLVEGMNGIIMLETQPGVGCRFIIRLPSLSKQ